MLGQICGGMDVGYIGWFGWMDGWIDDVQIDIWMDEWMRGWMDDVWMDMLAKFSLFFFQYLFIQAVPGLRCGMWDLYLHLPDS